MSALAWMAFCVAAGLGAPARYLIDGWVQDRSTGSFPWGTFAVNISGCLMLGLLTGLGLYRDLEPTTATVLGAGGVGAYTTFSTFAFETVRLAEEGASALAWRNAVGSVVLGLAAASTGLGIAAAL